jgi:putative endonuclease
MPKATQPNRKQIGGQGESDAAQFLRSRGYRIAAVNVRPLPGLARGELDIVAWDGPVLCFVEVKTRRSGRVDPDIAITLTKRKQLIRLAEAYLSANDLDPEVCRFDVVSIWSDPALPCAMLRLCKNAFEVQ